MSISEQCWEWQGTLDSYGYGVVKIGSKLDGTRRMVKVHRMAYEALQSPIAEGLVIDHLCRNKVCYNPSHLEPVTPGENSRRRNLAITHCPKGHEYTPENTYIWRGMRDCRACSRLRSQQRRRQVR
jgi:hypothetical protein